MDTSDAGWLRYLSSLLPATATGDLGGISLYLSEGARKATQSARRIFSAEGSENASTSEDEAATPTSQPDSVHPQADDSELLHWFQPEGIHLRVPADFVGALPASDTLAAVERELGHRHCHSHVCTSSATAAEDNQQGFPFPSWWGHVTRFVSSVVGPASSAPKKPHNKARSLHAYGRFQRSHAAAAAPLSYKPPVWTLQQRARDAWELQCMRNKSANEVRNALPVVSPPNFERNNNYYYMMLQRRGFLFYTGASWFPVINGVDLMDHPVRLIERGMFAKDVDVIYGSNKDEASIFLLFAYPFLMTRGLVRDFLELTVGERAHADAIWSHYVDSPAVKDVSLRKRVVSMLNGMWTCGSHYFAAHYERNGGRMRMYSFRHEPSYLSSMLKWLGAYHGIGKLA